MRKLSLLFIVMFSSFIAHANTVDPYYEIADVTVEVLDSSDGQRIDILEPAPDSELGDIIATTRQIIAFGKEIYKIVEAGKPVINTEHAPISVLPTGYRTW